MTDELITFETAKLAKEIGIVFPEFTDKMYRSSGELFNSSGLVIMHGKPVVYNAPTQSLLQRYLREKYKLDITIHPYQFSRLRDPEYKYYISDEIGVYKQIKKTATGSYEEALEAGLVEALKLIEKID